MLRVSIARWTGTCVAAIGGAIWLAAGGLGDGRYAADRQVMRQFCVNGYGSEHIHFRYPTTVDLRRTTDGVDAEANRLWEQQFRAIAEQAGASKAYLAPAEPPSESPPGTPVFGLSTVRIFERDANGVWRRGHGFRNR